MDVTHDALEVAAIYVLDADSTTEVRLCGISGTERMEAIQSADGHRVLRRAQGYNSHDFVTASVVTREVAMRQVSRVAGPELHIGEVSRVVKRDFLRVCRTLPRDAR